LTVLKPFSVHFHCRKWGFRARKIGSTPALNTCWFRTEPGSGGGEMLLLSMAVSLSNVACERAGELTVSVQYISKNDNW